MEDKKISSEVFEKILCNVEKEIQNGTPNGWINYSSMIKRAYYFGVLNALNSIADDEDIKKIAIKIIQETAFQQEIDRYIKAEIDKK